MGWDGMGWDAKPWDGMGWDGMGWDQGRVGWDGMRCLRMGWDQMGPGKVPQLAHNSIHPLAQGVGDGLEAGCLLQLAGVVGSGGEDGSAGGSWCDV